MLARIDSHRYAVSSRGFNDEYADKLLVMIEWSRVYHPLFGGVFWDQQDVMMEDVERIEVIRGPAERFGERTRSMASSTSSQERKRDAGCAWLPAAAEQRNWGSVRFAMAERRRKIFTTGSMKRVLDGMPSAEWMLAMEYSTTRADFAWIGRRRHRNLLTFSRQLLSGHHQRNVAGSVPCFRLRSLRFFSTKLITVAVICSGRWTHDWADDSQTELLAYFDHTERFTLATELRNTGMLICQHRFKPGDHQEIVAGLGYRVSKTAPNRD